MKKTNIFKLILMMIALALSGSSEAQISRNLHIGDGGNQAATNIRVLPDSSVIIAGYDYNIAGGTVTNSQMVLMRVSADGTHIIWQKKFGVAGANNLVYNMIITHDNNIVLVGTMGRSSVYSGNIASIMKFDALGNLIWQNNMVDHVHTVGGEIFYAVTELGVLGNYALVAVGTYDSRPTAMNSLICMFDNTSGQMIYDEMYNVDNNTSDGMYGICTSADGLSAYIVGAYNGDKYQSGMAFMYTPGMYAVGPYVHGNFGWKDFFDFTMPGLTVTYVNGKPVVTSKTLDLNDNFFVDVYLRGTKLLIYGGSMSDYITTAGEGESVTRLDAATGGTPENWQIQSSNMDYANVSKIVVLNSDHIINVQTPTTSWYDPIRWLTSTITTADVVLTDIPSLSADLITSTPVKYVSGSATPCLHALIDATLFNSTLYMAGVTDDPTRGFGGNDIYFVQTPSSLGLDTGGFICDSTDTTGQLAVPMTPYVHNLALVNFLADTIEVVPVLTNYAIDTLCGKKIVPHLPCGDASWNGPLTTLTSVNDNIDTPGCVFTVTADGTPNSPWSMMGYLWNIGGVITWDLLSSPTDNKTVILPYSGSQTVTVTFYATDAAGDTCTITRTINLNCPKPPCYDTGCTKLTIQSGANGLGTTGVGTAGNGGIAGNAPVAILTNDSCTFTACVNVCTPYTVVGYDWTLSSGGTVTTHHTSAHTDCFTFTIPQGVAVTVSVVAHIVDFNYTTDPCCEADLSQRVWCGDTTTKTPCVDSAKSNLSYREGVDAQGDCTYNFLASVAPISGWTITTYAWSVNGGAPTFGGPGFPLVIPPGGSAIVSVTVTLVDQNGDVCTYTMTVTVVCNNNTSRHTGGSTGSTDGTGDISIFPNPTSDAVTVSSTQISISNIQVIDVNGKKLVDFNYDNAKTANISLSNFPPGTYLFRVNNNTSQVVTKAK